VDRWKARLEFLLNMIELSFYLLRLRHYKAKCVKTRCLQEGGRSLGAKISGEGVVPRENFLVFTKLDTFCYLTVQTNRRFDRIPACDRQTDGQTDGIAIASRALAMRALRRAVKTSMGTTSDKRLDFLTVCGTGKTPPAS